MDKSGVLGIWRFH